MLGGIADLRLRKMSERARDEDRGVQHAACGNEISHRDPPLVEPARAQALQPCKTWVARPWSEGQGDAALPGDVVLRLVEPVAVERVDVVAPFRADAHALEPVLEPRAEVAGELSPGTVGAELMDADGAGSAEHVRNEGG